MRRRQLVGQRARGLQLERVVRARRGINIGEGAAFAFLERSGEGPRLLGAGESSDAHHMTTPDPEGRGAQAAMQAAIADAGVSPTDIDYVNAHGTATDVGDPAESHATARALGNETPISSTKSYTGHTLGACGALEAAFCISAIKNGFLPPNRNLDRVHDNCAPLNYIVGDARQAKLRTVMTNNFAFGGINTSLILRQL